MMTFLNFWPTTAEGWAGLIAVTSGFFISLGGLVGALVKLKGKGKQLLSALKQIAKNKDFDKIRKISMAAIEAAEASGKKGAEKKEMVMTSVAAGCKEMGIEISEEDLKEISEHVEDMVGFFNEMKKLADKNKKK